SGFELTELLKIGEVDLVAIPGVIERGLELPPFAATLVSKAVERGAIAHVPVSLEQPDVARNAGEETPKLHQVGWRRRVGGRARRRGSGGAALHACRWGGSGVRSLRLGGNRRSQHRDREQRLYQCSHAL